MLDSGVQFLKGIGPRKAELLKAEAGIETIEDLLYYAPRRYLDRSNFKSIGDCVVGETVTVAGTITGAIIAGKNRRFLQVRIEDGTGSLAGVFFGGAHYLQKILAVGETVFFSGKVDYYRTFQIVHPDFDFLEDNSLIQSINTGRIVPLYHSTEKLRGIGFDSRGFRRVIRAAIDSQISAITDPFDEGMRARHDLMPLADALMAIHFPNTLESAEGARRRLAFNELFFLQYYLSLSKRHIRESAGTGRRKVDPAPANEFISRLPFTLTSDQRRAIDEIKCDLELPFPMNRLLQGDVGSGKTVVAMAASLLAKSRGDQVALMAPTEVLASQHYRNFLTLLQGAATVALLTGSVPRKKKEEIYESIREGGTDIVIGTHALIQEGVNFKKLGLIIIDEQHRFGVSQRAALREKGETPDLLVMTATPIPRSLSLTIYGDMDLSYLKEKPAERVPIKTMALPESRLGGVYKSVRKYVDQGQQAYFVLPLIEESEKIDLKSAAVAFEHLKNVFPDLRIDMLHGRMQPEEKEAIMARFKSGETNILVSTTVIEVGVDVPNATVMVIEHAERFGLSQLHQLRGRVGRGSAQSYCVLVYPDDTPDESRGRIETIVRTEDGFEIAEEDLKARGSGEIIGTRQHGDSGLEFADLRVDLALIMAAREEAAAQVASIGDVSDILNSLKRHAAHSSALSGLRQKRILSILS